MSTSSGKCILNPARECKPLANGLCGCEQPSHPVGYWSEFVEQLYLDMHGSESPSTNLTKEK